MAFSKGKNAWSISQRSGLRYPYREMIHEPGTNVWIHYSESDGMYNAKDHPQGRVRVPASEPIALQYPTELLAGEFLLAETSEVLTYTGMFGQQIPIGI